jgi:hypothetical protein
MTESLVMEGPKSARHSLGNQSAGETVPESLDTGMHPRQVRAADPFATEAHMA